MVQVLEGPMRPSLYVEPLTQREKIAAAVEALKWLPQRAMPVTHRFQDGVYLREIEMPAGTAVIGHIHKTKHWNIVLKGCAEVRMGNEKKIVKEGDVFESDAGVQKLLVIHADCRWLTIHANPTGITDIATMEESIVELDPRVIAGKGELTLDEYRMMLGGIETSEIITMKGHNQ